MAVGVTNSENDADCYTAMYRSPIDSNEISAAAEAVVTRSVGRRKVVSLYCHELPTLQTSDKQSDRLISPRKVV